jgi:hypothetical protein
MATLPKEEPTNPNDQIHEVPKYKPEHYFHADAQLLEADLKAPVIREVKRVSHVKLEPDGTYKFQQSGHMRLEGIISYESGYTQVGGHKSPKPGHGFVTLTTSVVEGLNILDVLTADRVVAQISTEHPEWWPEGTNGRRPLQVPTVSFLGTRFENLRINGHKVEPKMHLEVLGAKPPADDTSYLDDDTVRDNVSKHYGRVKKAIELADLTKDEKEHWNDEHHCWNQDIPHYGAMKCSLVSEIDRGVPGIPFGHVIDLPHFGKIFLAELTVTREPAKPSTNGNAYPETYHVHLDMIRVELGCPAQGSGTVVSASSNGTGGKP